MKVRVVKAPLAHGFEYARPGAVIDLPERMAALYIKVGRAEEFTEEQPKRRRVYRRRDAQPEQKAVMTADPSQE